MISKERYLWSPSRHWHTKSIQASRSSTKFLNTKPIVRNQVQVKTSALFQCLIYLRGCNIPTISAGMNHVNNKGKIILIHSTSPLKQRFSILPILYFCIFYPLCFCFAEFSTRVGTPVWSISMQGRCPCNLAVYA